MSVKIFYGSEPYIIDKKLKREISCSNLDIYYHDEFSDNLVQDLQTVSFFDEKRVVVLTTDELKSDERLLDTIKSVSNSTDFFIVARNIDKRSSIYKYAKRHGLLFEFQKLNEIQLKKFVFQLLSQNGTKITNRAYNLMLERIDYFNNPDVTLYTVEIYVKQLLFLSKVITEKEVSLVVPETSNEKVYQLTKAILYNHKDKAFALAVDFTLRGENIIGMLSMMLRVFRLAFKSTLYNDVSNKMLGALLGVPVFQFQDALSIPENILGYVLDIIQESINGIKSGRCDAETMFLLAIGKIIETLYPSNKVKAKA